MPHHLISEMVDHQLERIRRICLSLPETSEKLAWGEPTFRVKGKLFAMYASASNHHGGGRDALWCHAPDGVQQGLVEAAPDRFFVPAYVGPKGWIGMWLDRVDDAEIEIHTAQAYRVVAPKKLRDLLDKDVGG